MAAAGTLGTAAAGLQAAQCTTDYLIIPNPVGIANDRFCGAGLAPVTSKNFWTIHFQDKVILFNVFYRQLPTVRPVVHNRCKRNSRRCQSRFSSVVHSKLVCDTSGWITFLNSVRAICTGFKFKLLLKHYLNWQQKSSRNSNRKLPANRRAQSAKNVFLSFFLLRIAVGIHTPVDTLR